MSLVNIEPIKYVRNSILKSKKPIQEWAFDLNVSRQTVYDWLNKDVNIRKKNIYRIASIMRQEITIINNTVKIDYEKTTKGESLMPVETRLQNHLLDEIESLKEMNAHLMTQVKAYESSQGSIESFARELDASSTFKEIAENLNTKRLQWDYVFDNMHHPLAVLRGKNIIRSVNNEFLRQFGYKKTEMVGKLLTNFIHPDDTDKCNISNGTNGESRCQVMKKNGKYCEVRCKSQSFGNEGNKFNLALMECVEKDCPDCV